MFLEKNSWISSTVYFRISSIIEFTWPLVDLMPWVTTWAWVDLVMYQGDSRFTFWALSRSSGFS